MPGKNFAIFIFATRLWCLATPPTISCMEMVTHSVFQRRNVSRISTLIKACQSLTAKNYHAKGRELTARIYSQLRRVDRRSWNTSAGCWCFYDKIGQLSVDLLDLQLEDTVLNSLSARIFWRKNFHRNKFLRTGVWSRKSRKFLPRKNFPLQKFPSIQ